MSWIKLHRDVLDSQAFANPTTFKIWCWMLLKANHKDKFLSMSTGIGFTDVSIKRGQLLFGRNKAESSLEIDGSTVYRHLQKLQDWGNIKIESNNQYSIITICKYDEYQTNDGEDEQPMNSERTTEEQQTDSKRTHTRIPKNDKNEEEVYNINELKNNFSMKEETGRALRVSPDRVEVLLDEFIQEQKAAGGLERELKEIRRHFVAWAKKKQENPVKPSFVHKSPKMI